MYYTYILASERNGTLYIGVTGRLTERIGEHKYKLRESFTKKYGVCNLVHAEEFQDIRDAITREKNLKNWKRKWKIDLIEKNNPQWKDLSIY